MFLLYTRIVLFILIQFYKFKKEHIKCIECCKKIINLQNDSNYFNFVIGFEYLEIKDYENAIFYLNKVINSTNIDKKLIKKSLVCRSKIYFELNKYDESEKDISTAIILDKRNCALCKQRAVIREYIKDYQGMIDDYTFLIKKKFELVESLYGRSISYFLNKEFYNARDDLDLALEIINKILNSARKNKRLLNNRIKKIYTTQAIVNAVLLDKVNLKESVLNLIEYDSDNSYLCFVESVADVCFRLQLYKSALYFYKKDLKINPNKQTTQEKILNTKNKLSLSNV